MKINKSYIILPTVLFLAAVFLLIVARDREQLKVEFTTYNELVESEYIEKGWLPDFFPESSKNIFETHNIDTNIVEAEFEYSTDDTHSVDEKCSEKDVIENGVVYKCRYEGSYIVFRLMNNGKGYLYSSPIR